MLAMGALFLGTTIDAHANMVLTLDDPTTAGIDIIIVDNVDGGVGTATGKGASNTGDGSALGGTITFNGGVGVFRICNEIT